jgi:hypothetical protein
MLIRLGEVQELLVRLVGLKTAVRNSTRPKDRVNILKNGQAFTTSRCTAGGAADLIGFLEQDVQPVDALVATVRAMSGYFYPIENLRFTGELGYYRQREWRIIGNIAYLGESLMDYLSQGEIQFLCAMDPEFFGRQKNFPTGTYKLAEECQWFRGVKGQTVAQTIRRIIVPRAYLLEAERLVSNRSLGIRVIALESLGA